MLVWHSVPHQHVEYNEVILTALATVMAIYQFVCPYLCFCFCPSLCAFRDGKHSLHFVGLDNGVMFISVPDFVRI